MCTVHERIRWLVGHSVHILAGLFVFPGTDMKCSRLFEFGGLLICITAARRVLMLTYQLRRLLWRRINVTYVVCF